MADVPTIRIGYVPGMCPAQAPTPTSLRADQLAPFHEPLATHSITMDSTDKLSANRALPDSPSPGSALPGRILSPVQDRPDPVPLRDGPYDYLAAGQ